MKNYDFENFNEKNYRVSFVHPKYTQNGTPQDHPPGGSRDPPGGSLGPRALLMGVKIGVPPRGVPGTPLGGPKTGQF